MTEHPAVYTALTLPQAIELALPLLERQIEALAVAAKMLELMGDNAPADVRRDARRRRELVEAREVLRRAMRGQ